jgi:predicted nucleotidyltransferase
MVDDRNGFRTIGSVCGQHVGVRLGVVFGSRARGDATVASDWDIGIVGDADLDHDALLADLVRTLDTDRIDLVDLERAGALVSVPRSAGWRRRLRAGAREIDKLVLRAQPTVMRLVVVPCN